MVTNFFYKIHLGNLFTASVCFIRIEMKQEPFSLISLLPYDAIIMPFRLHENRENGFLAKPCICVKEIVCCF